MIGRILASTGMVFALCALRASPQSDSTAPSPQKSVGQSSFTDRSLLDRYCVTRHNEKLTTAGLMLDRMNLEQAGEDAAVWEKVVHKLRTRSMPPAGMPRPDAAGYNLLITRLETELDRSAAIKPNPGRPAIHRLNRAEYTNAIRDLGGVSGSMFFGVSGHTLGRALEFYVFRRAETLGFGGAGGFACRPVPG